MLTVRLNNLPIYKTLMERLKEIITQKDQETQDTLSLLSTLTGDFNEAIKAEDAMGVSKGEMALRQLVSEKLPKADTEGFSDILKGVITKHTFPGWDNQTTVKGSIKRDIIIELANYSKEHPEAGLNPDDFSEFSKEAMTYVEKHF